MQTTNSNDRVLVTGVFGFVGSHVTKLALDRGYKVRGTIRGAGNDPSGGKLGRQLRVACGLSPEVTEEGLSDNRLEFVNLDLMNSSQDDWNVGLTGCQYCLHVAAPVVSESVSDPATVLRPTIDGTAKILQACAHARVRHVVVCSSVSAINAGHPHEKTTFSDKDWNIVPTPESGKKLFVYEEAKQIAEQKAWSLAQELNLNLSCVVPTAIFGPCLLPRVPPTGEALTKIIQREIPLFPKYYFNSVDVRDVAELHLDCIGQELSNEAKGHRLIADAGEEGHISMMDISHICNKAVGDRGWQPVSLTGPYWLFWLASTFKSQVAFILPQIERQLSYDTSTTQKILKKTSWRSVRGAIAEMAASMDDLEMLDRSRKNRLVALVKAACPIM